MSENKDAESSATLPGKIVVTLRAGGVFFAIANVICVAILVWAYMEVKFEPKTLAVTGSAHKAIVSDLVTWTGTITTKDATSRAEQIVNNANGRLGKLVEARMGVMQINPKGVSATSSEGNNDTSSFEKDITSVVSVKFEVR